MKTDHDKTPPQKVDAPQGELMKCPKCGHDTFAMGKTVTYKERRYWRVLVRVAGMEGLGLREEEVDKWGSYDYYHIICRKCDATFWENDMMDMWKAEGWSPE